MKEAFCHDCGQYAKWNDLEPREPWNGGYRHKYGTGCWPKPANTVRTGQERDSAHEPGLPAPTHSPAQEV